MNRRNFLAILPPLAGLPFLRAAAMEKRSGPLTIRDVEIWQVSGHRKPDDLKMQWQVSPASIYQEDVPPALPETKPTPSSPVLQQTLYLKILTREGVEGFYGMIDPETAIVIDRQLRPLLIGQDPLAGEILWDKMFRSNRHSRAGHFMMAISAVDNALWDLRGRYFNMPVYRLLGGPSRDRIEAYASCLGHRLEPDEVRLVSAGFRDQGYRYQKWFFTHGPSAGAGGLMKNIELVRTLREALGTESEILFDAFMGWDLDYALEWAKMAEPFRPYWIEEAFHPDKLESFAELRKKTTIPVATGEHFYGRWEVLRFLKADAIDVVQADPEWCGGTSELVKICALASAYDARVIPHGHNIHAALHVAAAQSPMTCPMVEYLVNFVPEKCFFEKHPLRPVGGKITLPDRPGFGIELDDSKIESRKRMKWE